MSTTWVDKYKPKNTNELIGQSRNVARIKSWLKTYEPIRSRPLFIYGPPGIGKTTAAHLCCKETGYTTVEFNASDQRNKNIIKEVVNTVASNSRLNFFGRASESKDAIILDEIDGMAGNEDRGGIAQLIIEIKSTKKPMIFICNDGQHQKLRALKDKCETIEFKRPDYEAIKSVVAKISSKEGLQMSHINIRNLAESSDYDIRQVVNSLYLFKGACSDQVTKTTRMNTFEATKKALTYSKQSIEDRFECFFADYNIMPLFIFENYIKNRPVKGDQLKAISRAADSICLSDLAEKEIRSNQNWSLLNVQALLSTVIPSNLVASNTLGRIDFPQFLGKLSNANKRLRLTQELNAHMCLSLRSGLDPYYLDVMRDKLSAPLMKKDALGGVDAVIDFMHDYSLLREDFNSIMELATWSFNPDPMTKVDTKTKTAFTLAYKKRSIALPYFSEEMTKKRRATVMDDSEGEEDEDEEEVIKPKRVVKNEKTKTKSNNTKTKPDNKATKAESKTTKAESKTTKAESKTTKLKNGQKQGAKSQTSEDEVQVVDSKTETKNGLTKAKEAPAATPKVRPPEGIARFFIAKKQKVD